MSMISNPAHPVESLGDSMAALGWAATGGGFDVGPYPQFAFADSERVHRHPVGAGHRTHRIEPRSGLGPQSRPMRFGERAHWLRAVSRMTIAFVPPALGAIAAT